MSEETEKIASKILLDLLVKMGAKEGDYTEDMDATIRRKLRVRQLLPTDHETYNPEQIELVEMTIMDSLKESLRIQFEKDMA